MATTLKQFAANNTWICPPGVTTVNGNAYAGGGAGAGGGVNPTTGGGGGGGAYSSNNFTPTAGLTYTIVVGAGGTTGVSPKEGGNSSIAQGATSLVVAEGGRSVANNSATGLAGGAAANGTGDNLRTGGAGANGNATVKGGGGGSSGGTGATGRGGQGNVGGGNGSDSANLPTGAQAGGNGAKTASAVGTAPAATFYGGGGGGAARNNTTARAGGVGRIGYVQLSYTTPLASSLTDNFDDNTQDTGKWIYGTVGAGSTIAETNGRIEMNPAASVAGAEVYLVYQAFSPDFDLTGSYFHVKASQVLNAGTQYAQLAVHKDDNNVLFWFVLGNPQVLIAAKYISPTYTELARIAYNSSTMLYWRIREASGVMYWEYSAGGVSWTELWHENNPFVITAVYPKLQAIADNVASPGTAIFDNFNVVPSVTSVKTINGLTYSSVATVNGLAVASVKSINGLTTQ